jgi:hypothetical protein
MNAKSAIAPIHDLSVTAAQILYGELLFMGKVNSGLLIDGSRSMGDEYGLDKKRRPIPGAVNQIERAVAAYLALARYLDPNGVAQGVFFSETVKVGEPIRLDNYAGWVDRNRLGADEMLGTDMALGLQEMLRVIAMEVGCETIAELALFAHPSNHNRVPAEPIRCTPYQLTIFTDGEPEDVVAVENLLRAMSYAPIEVVIFYVSNQAVGLDILHSLTQVTGRLFNNVRLVNLGKGGLQRADDATLLRSFAEGLPAFERQITEHGLIVA